MKKYIVYLTGKPMIGTIEVNAETPSTVIDKDGNRIYKSTRHTVVVESLDQAMQALIKNAVREAEQAKKAAEQAEEHLEKVKSYVRNVKELL